VPYLRVHLMCSYGSRTGELAAARSPARQSICSSGLVLLEICRRAETVARDHCKGEEEQ
jgi:hypothetical protein